MAQNAAMRPRCCVAMMPSAPKASVTRPSPTSTGPPNSAETPASCGNSSVHTRRMAYTPSLVMMANSADTGAAAAEYVEGSQKLSGQAAALTRKATARMAAPACSRPRSSSGMAGTMMAMSAMFSVPVTPYRMATPIRNMLEAIRFMAM